MKNRNSLKFKFNLPSSTESCHPCFWPEPMSNFERQFFSNIFVRKWGQIVEAQECVCQGGFAYTLLTQHHKTRPRNVNCILLDKMDENDIIGSIVAWWSTHQLDAPDVRVSNLAIDKNFSDFRNFLLSITSCLITRILYIFECTQRILFNGIWIWIASNSMQKRQMKPFNPVIPVSLLAMIVGVLVSGTLPYCK